MPATPVLSNGGTKRGLPISCFLNEASDSLDGIVGLWNENVWLASQGRRHRQLLGQSALDRREGRAERQDLGRDPVHPGDGQPDARDQPGLAAARLGGGLSAGRRIPRSRSSSKSAARPAATRTARRSTCITACWCPDAFMRAVEADEAWALTSPKDGSVVRTHLGARAVDPHPDRADRDRRAVSGVHRPCEPRAARSIRSWPGWR